MSPIPVSIKHAGNKHDLALDPDQDAAAFKAQIYSVTGVAPDRMKVMIKGGMLKDDADMAKLAGSIKPGHTFMVLGTAGELPKAPEKPVVFMEDMDESELADALRVPAGLVNLGNTCYLNSSLQVLRAIPELQTALNDGPANTTAGGSDLTKAMKQLYTSMAKTTEGFPPYLFLQALRQAYPTFAEKDRTGNYAQQDAEEAWGSILTSLHRSVGSSTDNRFVEQYMRGTFVKELKNDESPDEPATQKTENFLKIDCNISVNTNYLHSGLKDGLDQKIEKHSATLGRNAIYSEQARIARLPSYLTVHLVRFYWRAQINKKAKIMRKVKFPFELDVLDFVTDELNEKLLPVNRKLKAVQKDREERRRIRKRMKNTQEAVAKAESSGDKMQIDEANTAAAAAVAPLEGGELGDETVLREQEQKELEALVHPDLAKDVGANTSGLYELIGLVTHKGAHADGGHYISWVRADVHDPKAEPDQWFKFDDDKVSTVSQDKIALLDGGGEDSSAYILLYRSSRI